MLIVSVMAALVAEWLKLVPTGMSHGWLFLANLGLVGGGLTSALMLEEFIIHPAQLQAELAGSQIVTPLSLRTYAASGFQDPEWDWIYAVDPETAANLQRHCLRPIIPGPGCVIGSANAGGRDAEILLDGNTLTIMEGYM
jgi:hypothetical protein